MPVRFASADDGVLHRGAVAALLGKSRRDDHRVPDAGGGALLERAEHRARRNDDDGEIDRLADIGDRRIAFQPVDIAVVGIDRIELARDSRSCAASTAAGPESSPDRAMRRSGRCCRARRSCRADAALRDGPLILVWRSMSLDAVQSSSSSCRAAQRPSEGDSPVSASLRGSLRSHRRMTESVSGRSRRERKRYAAEQERIARHLQPFALAASRTCAMSATLNVSPLMISLAPLTKRKLQLGSFSSGSPLSFLLDGNPDDLAPVLGERLRLRALHLDPDQRLRHILADRFLPVRAGRRIGPQNIVAAIGVVELDEGGAAIARMQLHAVIGRVSRSRWRCARRLPWRACRARRDRRSRRSPCSRRGRRSCR